MIGMEILDGSGQSNYQRGRVVRELGDNTLADAILDRLMHNAHRLSLKGESMRRECELTQSEQSS